jgi:hypothetical protein
VDDTPAQQLANLQIPQAPATRQRSLPSPKVPGKCMLWNFPANPDPTPPAAVRPPAHTLTHRVHLTSSRPRVREVLWRVVREV